MSAPAATAIYIDAALADIADLMSLAAFAYRLSRVKTDATGREFAAYGGVYMSESTLWHRLVESARPGRVP